MPMRDTMVGLGERKWSRIRSEAAWPNTVAWSYVYPKRELPGSNLDHTLRPKCSFFNVSGLGSQAWVPLVSSMVRICKFNVLEPFFPFVYQLFAPKPFYA